MPSAWREVRRWTAWAAVFAGTLAASRAAKVEQTVTLWYGDEQRFGHLGNPQPRILLVAHHSDVTFGDVEIFALRKRD